jgi:hypothetical protein
VFADNRDDVRTPVIADNRGDVRADGLQVVMIGGGAQATSASCPTASSSASRSSDRTSPMVATRSIPSPAPFRATDSPSEEESGDDSVMNSP